MSELRALGVFEKGRVELIAILNFYYSLCNSDRYLLESVMMN